MTHDPMDCERCGEPHRKCRGHNRAGKPCGNDPMHDQAVCQIHGGKSPQALEAAARRKSEREALLAVEVYGLPREIDPHSALLEELHRTAGAVQWLAAVVADLDRTRVAGDVPASQLWIRLLGEERDRLVKVAKTCVDVGIEERRVRLAESAGAQLAGVIRSTLDALLTVLREVIGDLLGQHPEVAAEVFYRTFEQAWSTAVLEIVPRELRRLSGDVVAGEVVA